MMEQRFALPHRSPYPLIVPCTCVTPFSTATRELATAISESLWVWIPSGSRVVFRTSRTIFATSDGSEPPLVSHRTRQSAPPSAAAASAFMAYFGFRLYPSKKCSASKNISSVRSFRYSNVSRMAFRFSSSVVRSASVT